MFGFQKSNVIAYIQKIQNDFAERDKKNSEKIKQLEQTEKDMAEQLEALKAQLSDANSKLLYYSEKEAEIEKMSVSIGTMYLAAKQNAKDILASADRCAKEISEHSKQQLAAAKAAEQQLLKMKEDLNDTSERFSEEICDLAVSLENMQDRLSAELARLDCPNDAIELLHEE